MDTQHLQAFVAVAETGSFSAAGQRLHLTQPAISKRIATLEQQLNTPLFDRVGRQISLTHAGRLLLTNARRILQEVADTERAIMDLQGEVRGQLSIATSHHIGLHRLPPTLRHFTEHYPEVKLDLHFLDSEQVYHEVLQGRFDVGIVTLAPESHPHIAEEMLWQDKLDFVVAHNHPLARRDRITLADLAPWQAILPDAGTYTTQLVQQLFDADQLVLEIGMVANHLDILKMMVSIGLGWGVLPQTLSGDGQVHPLPMEGITLVRELGTIHHRQRSLNNAARVFLQWLRE